MKIKDSITVTKIRKSEISLFGFFLLLFPIALNIRTVFIQQEIIDAGASLMMVILEEIEQEIRLSAPLLRIYAVYCNYQ